MIESRPAAENLAEVLATRRVGHSLPGQFYNDPAALAFDFERVWHREWVFAGNECELTEPGSFLTLTVGAFPLIVVRGNDGVLRALHNVCRHRGSLICEASAGTVKRRFVCPYHQWSYELDGALAASRGGAAGLDSADYALGTAHCETAGGLVFVCVADEPPDFGPVREMVEPYLAPFDLRNARVAHETAIIEHGNWKLVMENNRECYHCRATHPELSMTFPLSPLHSGGGDGAERAAMEALVERCEADGLPSRFVASDDNQLRAMRMAFTADNRSMTMDGAPAVARRFGNLPDYNIGDVLLYHYPSMWSHFTADHAVTFRIAPTGPTTTELRTTWLVPGDAVEGVDYDLERLTEVWNATNAQDTALVERAQRGVASPAYRPGPYTAGEEDGVIQFINWYAETVHRSLSG
jgi:phenylpropionate dioxygenase-like ring-hydroxylating dioxygenase large terminal subunit